MNDYMTKSGLKACVISVSGGVDSAVCLAIALYAQKKEGSPIQKVCSSQR
jgi:NAD+ synthase (glutamine-hydrolysing)